MNNDVLLAAIEYLKIGFSIIPIQPHGKLPEASILPRDKDNKPKWQVYQERPPLMDEARQWFETRPSLNIAIVTGMISGIVVVDIDSDEAGKVFKQTVGKHCPPTFWAKTSQGWHAYFRYPKNVTLGNRVGFLPGIDLRSDGGFVVAPPSVHASGAHYEWNKRIPTLRGMAELPEPILKILTEKERAKREAVSYRIDATGNYAKNAERIFNYQCRVLTSTPAGFRNDALNYATFVLARIVRTGALNESNVRETMRGIALSIGLGEKETDATINSAMTAGLNDPRPWSWEG